MLILASNLLIFFSFIGERYQSANFALAERFSKVVCVLNVCPCPCNLGCPRCFFSVIRVVAFKVAGETLTPLSLIGLEVNKLCLPSVLNSDLGYVPKVGVLGRTFGL